jgi:HPt (histidine-containing phosphotransfer) domain-containing protein
MSTAPDTTLAPRAPGVEHAAWTVDALRAVWERQHGRVDERIETIERAVTVLASGSLDATLRREAERAAHMLSGSLGMFGFILAADAARRIELEFAHPRIDRAPALSGLLARVRAGVRGPVVLCSDASIEADVSIEADTNKKFR